MERKKDLAAESKEQRVKSSTGKLWVKKKKKQEIELDPH